MIRTPAKHLAKIFLIFTSLTFLFSCGRMSDIEKPSDYQRPDFSKVID